MTGRILSLFTCALLPWPVLGQESLEIGIVDFYGLGTITEEEVRTVLPFSEGDSIAIEDLSFDKPSQQAMESAMADALGVERMELTGVCCSAPNVGILFVGIEQKAGAGPRYRRNPTGHLSLPSEILETDRELEAAIRAVVQAGGDSGFSWSEGYALANDPKIRALQTRYVDYAERYQDALIEVLDGSDSSDQRAIAATVLEYASDKKTVIPHLLDAALDPDEDVRNNATATLMVIALYSNDRPELKIKIRPDVFIDMLNSVVWTDRNKASAVLWPLTQSRDEALMQRIRDKALPALIDMCRWKSDGHAFMPCIILERVVGLPDQNELHPKETTIAMAQQLMKR